MLTDKLNTFSDQQAVTATALSTDVVDLGPLSGGNLVRDLGAGEPAWLAITVQEAALAAGAATVQFSLESDDNAGLASATVHWQSAAIGKAALVPGYQIAIPLPAGAYERYLGVRYTVATGPLTAGKFTAQIVKQPDLRRDYASGFTTGV